ncbi:MAG: right-handed parallel beta-helix repeat-containing protein [Candidatus Methanospirare jalkutatii]|nr:MAG: right-handed parallel beta-helix repeat-containing protein [Candidatus Methanospirare jalkutatii]UYZ40815.1 MAG: right-handed parallel beta-helix repeat-containing protein [Candidatus Methanospirare jalkutatii]
MLWLEVEGAMMFKGKLVFPVFASFLILTALASVSEAKTIYVPDDYARIQWAVDNASDGDTIIVRDGIYYESITVSKRLTIKSENGTANCIVNGSGSDVFTLEADGIRIEGFTITGGRYGICIRSNKYGIYIRSNKILNNNIISNNYDGILLWHSIGNSISNNNISNNYDGIDLRYSDNNSISNNIISSNNHEGIGLWDSNNNMISNNIISSNNDNGIYFKDSNNNSISENNISSNNHWGVVLWNSSKNTIEINKFINDGLSVDYSYGNIVKDNTVNGKPLVYLENKSDEFVYNAGQVILVKCTNITVINSELKNTDVGIELWRSNNCLISANNISNNYEGIDLRYSDNNSISNNIISSNIRGISFFLHSDNNSISCNNFSNNSYGIYIHHSNNNSIAENNFSNNWHGICIHYSSNNIIYLNNFINNTYNADSYGIRINNIWNSTEEITYTYKGSNFTNYMGNYWDDYNGSDANGDGLGDTAYMIPSLYDKDYHPLIEKFENYIVAEKEEREVPGFEVFFAIAGLLAVAYLLIRKR